MRFNKVKNILVFATVASVCMFGQVNAASNDDKNKPAVPKPVKKAVDISTKFTRACVSLGAKTEPENRQLKAMPQGVHKRMNQAIELIGKEQFEDARDILLGLYERNKGNNYLKASIAINLAYVYNNMNQIAQAIRYYEIAVNEKVMPLPREQNARINLAGMLYGESNYDKSMKVLKDWFSFEQKPASHGYRLLAALYIQKNKVKESICPAYLALQSDDEHDKSMFGFLLNGHMEMNDMPGATKVVTAMVEIWPEETKYWRYLVAIYAKSENPERALAVLELMHRQKMFDMKSDYNQLYSYYGLMQIPFKAAEVLKEGLEKGLVESNEKNWKSVGQYYHAAQELPLAIEAYRKTSELVDNGTYLIKIADLYSDLEKWSEAIKAFDSGLKKGGLEEEEVGKVYYRKGIALFRQDKFEEAIEILEIASKYKKEKKNSQRWIGYVQSRIRTRDQLANR